MFFHFICVSNNFLDSRTLYEMFIFGKLGVQIFFIISGFILFDSLYRSGYRLKTLPLFILKRIIRIEPPYILSIFLIILIAFIKFEFSFSQNEAIIDWKQLFFHLGYIVPFTEYNWLNIVYWTLAIEFQFYLLIAISFPVLKSPNGIFFNVVLILLTTVFAQYITTLEILYWAPIFMIGILKAQLDHMIISKKEFYIALILILIQILLQFDIQIFAVSLLTIILLIRNKEFDLYALRFLGKISYSLYLFHTIIGFSILNLLSRISVNYSFRFLSLIVVSFIVIYISYLIHKYVENPFKIRASNIKLNK